MDGCPPTPCRDLHKRRVTVRGSGEKRNLSSPEMALEKIGFDVDLKEIRKGYRVVGSDMGSFSLMSEGGNDRRARQRD